MRRRIQSDSEVKRKNVKPLLKEQSHSLIQERGPRNCDMHLLLPESHRSENNIPLHFNSMQPTDLAGSSPTSSPTNTSQSERLSPPLNDDVLLCDVKSLDSGRPISASSLGSGRPTSLSSVTSSRTSRGSDYFSSSSSGENQHQLMSYSLGTQFEFPTDLHEMECAGTRTVLNKLVESVREEEEEEEGFVDDEDYVPMTNSHFNNSSNKKDNDEPKQTQTLLNSKPHLGVSVRDINKKLSEVDHLSPIATLAMVANPQLTYVDRIILELLETERMYVRALEDILAGYILAIKNASDLPISPTDVQNLFGNIKDIYAFNRKFMILLENSENNPVNIASHFVSKDISFNVYTEYCTNYPVTVGVLTRSMKNPALADFFKNQQASLRHNLPLGSYLLKPVQRILKYHLILQELVKNCDHDIDNYCVIEEALSTMTYIAHHINEMKRKHEDAVRIQEIQSLLINWQGDDLTTYGELVLEGDLKLQGAKNERLVFLFDKIILITKKREDGFLVCKIHIMCSDLILLESIKENPLSFLISPFDNPTLHPNNHGSRLAKMQYVLTPRFPEDKKLWTQHIKRLIIKNHHAAIPLHAQQSIMNMTDDSALINNAQHKKSRFSNISLDEGKRPPFKRLSSTVSQSTLGLNNGKPRRRSDSTTRKSLQLKSLRRKRDIEMSDDVSSDSVPNTPTLNPGKNRFSFPRIMTSSSPKQDPVESAIDITSPIHVVEEAVQEDMEEKKEEEDRKPEERKKEKTKKTAEEKKKERHKQSVIYRRHKRRTSQPITDIEMRLSIRVATDDEGGDQAGNHDLPLGDLEAADEFLTFEVDNNRESVSWDIQIVEAVFERFKQEKMAENGEQTNVMTMDTPALMSMQKHYQNPRTRILSSSDNSDVENTATTYTEKPKSPSKHSARKQRIKSDTSGRETDSDGDSDHKARGVESAERIDPIKTQNSDSKRNLIVKTDMNSNHIDKPNTAHSEDEALELRKNADKFDPATPSSGSVNDGKAALTKVKRTLSTQTTLTERRKYFDRLKEIRDRRHSQLSLGSDAKAIHSGIVKEMIEHHRESITSQSQGGLSPVPITAPQDHPFSQVELSRVPVHPNDYIYVENRAHQPTAESNVERKYTTVKLRRPERHRNLIQNTAEAPAKTTKNTATTRKEAHRSLDLDALDHKDRISTLTTGSLPLHFTSSSSSSSSSNGNCSSNDCEEPECTSPVVLKLKKLIQPPMILWRSYSEENGSNTRRSRNLMIETSSPECTDRNEHTKTGDLSQQESKSRSENRFSFKSLGSMSMESDTATDKMSEHLDYVIETVDKNLNRVESSSESLLDEKIPHQLRHDDDKAASEHNKRSPSPSNLTTSATISLKTQQPTSPASAKKNAHQIRLASPENERKDPAKTKPVSPEDQTKRQGRDRSRNLRRNAPTTSSCSVMKLAHQFDNLSSTTKPASTKQPYRRSQSVGAKKMLHDRRLAVQSRRAENTEVFHNDTHKMPIANADQQNNSKFNYENRVCSPPRAAVESHVPAARRTDDRLTQERTRSTHTSTSSYVTNRTLSTSSSMSDYVTTPPLVDPFTDATKSPLSLTSLKEASSPVHKINPAILGSDSDSEELFQSKTQDDGPPSDFVARFCKV